MDSRRNTHKSIRPNSFKKGVKRASSRAGLSPGSVDYIGKDKSEIVKINTMSYGKSGFSEHALKKISDVKKHVKKDRVDWVNITGVHDVKLLKDIGKLFEIHPLTLEDIADTTQRPKIEDHKKYLFIVLKIAYLHEVTGEITVEQISIVADKKNIITFQEGEKDIFNPLRERIRRTDEAIRSFKSDFLIYAIIDSIVDHYFVVLEKYEDEIERIENLLINEAKQEILNDIYRIKRELTILRKSIWPSRDIINNLLREDYKLITKPVEMYFKDIYDHVIQIVEAIEAMRDISTGMLELYLSSVSNKMNEIMKILTMFSAFFIPLTFIVGIYGMNFEHMPELSTQWGYFVVWGVIITVSVSLFVFFKKKRWM